MLAHSSISKGEGGGGVPGITNPTRINTCARERAAESMLFTWVVRRISGLRGWSLIESTTYNLRPATRLFSAFTHPRNLSPLESTFTMRVQKKTVAATGKGAERESPHVRDPHF